MTAEGKYRRGLKTQLFQQAYNLRERCVEERIGLNWSEVLALVCVTASKSQDRHGAAPDNVRIVAGRDVFVY